MPGQLKVASSCEHEDKPEQRKTHSVAPAQLTARVVPWQLDVWSHSTMHRSFGAHTIVSHKYCCAALSYTQLGCAYVPGGGGIDGPGGGGTDCATEKRLTSESPTIAARLSRTRLAVPPCTVYRSGPRAAQDGALTEANDKSNACPSRNTHHVAQGLQGGQASTPPVPSSLEHYKACILPEHTTP